MKKTFLIKMICVVYIASGTFSVTVQANNSTLELVDADELVIENPENENISLTEIEPTENEDFEDDLADPAVNDSVEDTVDSAESVTAEEALEDVEQRESVVIPAAPTVTLNGSLEVDGYYLNANSSNSWDVPIIDLPFEDFSDHPYKKTFSYRIEVMYEEAPIMNTNYEEAASRNLPAGAEVAVTVPELLEVIESSIGYFNRVGDQYIFTLPEMGNKETLTIEFTAVVRSDLSLIQNININQEEEFLATFRGENIIVETSGRPMYRLQAIFGPTLEGDYLYDAADNNRLIIPSEAYHYGFNLEAEDLNSTTATIYTSDWLQYYDLNSVPDFPNPIYYQFYDTFNRTYITSEFVSVYFEIDVHDLRMRFGSGEFYKVFYLQDAEGNISQRKYLSIILEPERGEMYIDSVPNLKFEDIDLANTTVEGDFVISSLRSGEVNPNPSLAANDGNDNLQLTINNMNSGLARWSLDASLENFYLEGNTGADRISSDDIQIILDIAGSSRIITNTSNTIYEMEGFDGLDISITTATLGISQSAIRAGKFQGAINWTLVNFY